MKGFEHPEYLIVWIVSNAVGVLILWAAYKSTRVARGIFFLLFGWACWANYTTVHATPEVYLDYASMSVQWYSDFILGWFQNHIVAVVTTIAAGQALIAIGMLLKGRWVTIACVGAIIFLLGIAPLGVGAGFPFSITVSIAAWIILKKDKLEYLWNFKRRETILI